MSLKSISPFSIQTNQIIMFLFILLFISSIKALSFKYPTAFTLKNGNIFIIHSLGIDICDSNYTTNKTILKFSDPIYKSGLSTISISKYSNGEFIAFIIENIYLFNANGEKIFSYKHSYASGLYYTLSAQKINQENNFYYYLFGYISGAESDLNLYYCRINLVNKKIDYLSSLTRYKINVKSQGLSCQFISNESNDYIMCLYNYNPESQNYLYVSIFDFDETGITLSDHNRFKKLQNTTYIQSAIKSKNSKPFFCGLLDNGKSYCLIYDYYDFYNENENNNSFISWDRKNEKKCKIKPYNVKTYYFPETDQYVFSCLTEDNGVQTTFYKKNMTQMSEIKNRSLSLQTEFTGCDEFYYSIVYSKINNKFYILSDIDCEPYQQFIPIAEGEIDIIEESKTEEENTKMKKKKLEKKN